MLLGGLSTCKNMSILVSAIATAPRFGLSGRLSGFIWIRSDSRMLFHVQEVRFDPPRIARALAELDLVFVGFELPSESIGRAFAQYSPASEARYDLAAWDRFEAENPTVFAAMYQFWCQAG